MVRLLIIGLLSLSTTVVQADDITDTLDRINNEIVSTELQSLNCLMVAQKNNTITSDCYDANQTLDNINTELMDLVDTLTSDLSDLRDQFPPIMIKIKQYRIRLQKINDNLERAKEITGVYNWTDKVAPSFYLQKINQ